jgi:hypothetical protein
MKANSTPSERTDADRAERFPGRRRQEGSGGRTGWNELPKIRKISIRTLSKSVANFKGEVGDLTAKDAKEEMAGRRAAKSREMTRRGEKKVGGRAGDCADGRGEMAGDGRAVEKKSRLELQEFEPA